MGNLGQLYLIPSTLGDTPINTSLPAYNLEVINSLDEFIVEDIRTARRFLIKAGITRPIDLLNFYLLNEHTRSDTVGELLAPLLKGKNMGLISDAGCPGIADPGSSVVRLAHEKGIKVIPLVGPSSILMALIASGLNGQLFAFHGYLPKQANDRAKKLKQLEADAVRTGSTQIFIETPYRNDSIIKDILTSCKDETLLSIASDISLPSEKIKTRTIAEWKREKASFNDHPAVFLIGASLRK